MKFKAFTLAELLIALAILGVIATFTIPKVLTAQQDANYKAIAKEAAAAMSGALQQYQVNNQVTASTSFGDLTPFINYVKVDTTSTMDHYYGSGSWNCNSGICLKLHNGAFMNMGLSNSFSGTDPNVNGMCFLVDPDGKDSGTTTGPGKSVQFCMYVNGRMTTRQALPGNITSSSGSGAPCGGCDPPWFNWN